MFKTFANRLTGGGRNEPPAHLVETIRAGCKQGARAICHLQERRDSYATTLLGLTPPKGGVPKLVVDTLIPRVARNALVEGETILSMNFTVSHIPYRGEFVFLGVETWDGFDALTLSLPMALIDQQRREHFRVEPKFANPVHIRIASPVEGEGEVLDISQGGVRIRTIEPVPAGEVAEIFLAMPTTPGAWVELKAKVVESGQLPPGVGKPGDRRHFVRLQFVTPDVEPAREINQYIVIRQRENLKRLS